MVDYRRTDTANYKKYLYIKYKQKQQTDTPIHFRIRNK